MLELLTHCWKAIEVGMETLRSPDGAGMTEFGIVMEPSPGNTGRLAAQAEQCNDRLVHHMRGDCLMAVFNSSPTPCGKR